MAINERRAAAGDDVIAFGLIIMRNGARNCIRRGWLPGIPIRVFD
jgi:hypothetical protein